MGWSKNEKNAPVSLNLCKKILQLRKDSKLKYENMELSGNVDETHG